MEKESLFLRNRSLKGPTERILKSVDLKRIEMEFTQENFSKERDMEKENLYGTIYKPLRANGEMGKRTALDCGDLLVEIITKANGKIIDKMDKDIMFISEVQSIKGNSRIF